MTNYWLDFSWYKMNKYKIKHKHKINIPKLNQGVWELEIPASKSLTNRAIHLAALAHGTSLIKNPLSSVDTETMLNVWSTLGAGITRKDNILRIKGCEGLLTNLDSKELYVSNAGTVARFITAILSISENKYKLKGDSAMNQRPLDGLVLPLIDLGVNFDFLQNRNCTPFVVKGSSQVQKNKSKIHISCNKSSQFLSAFLMIAPFFHFGLDISYDKFIVSFPYVTMTLAMMKKFGARYTHKDNCYSIPFSKGYKGSQYEVEIDYSSASYFLALAAIHGSTVTILNAKEKSFQGDRAFVCILEKMNCRVKWTPKGLTLIGPARLNSIVMNMKDMTDLVPSLAVVAMFSQGTTVIEGIDHMRYKECDRIYALCKELSKFGADIKYREQKLIIKPKKTYLKATCETYNDHRMAMAFSIAATKIKGTSILDPGCVNKTFPTFFNTLSLCL